ncbi:MAG: LacI family DNA-binding transcriptional regulator [Spirochaetales bacterium]|nr:LacI family DNA-binding transcriptional regulator [Spirochaetales bacterium]
MATIREVAKNAGVSIATVSRVLNHPDTVAPETSAHILKVMDDLDFSPNGPARSLALKKTYTIGLLVPDILNPVYPEIAKGVGEIVNKKGFQLLLCNTEGLRKKETEYIQSLESRKVDGLILTDSQLPDEEIERLKKQDTKIVHVGKKRGFGADGAVFTDFSLGAFMAVSHLTTLGYKKIAFISGPEDHLENREKGEGYRKALGEAALPLDSRFTLSGDNDIEGGYLAAKKLLKMKTPPEAIFAAGDLMAIGAMEAVKSENLRIPEDVAIVGYDNIRISALVEPKLTTITYPVYRMGLIAARLLFNSIDNGSTEPENIYLEPGLVVRRSCGNTERVTEIFN